MSGIQTEVFKTNVREVSEAKTIIRLLLSQYPGHRFNFDLDDCDKILRAEGIVKVQDKTKVMNIVAASGYMIEVLPE